MPFILILFIAPVGMLIDCVILALLVQSLPPGAVALTPITDANINTAAELWISNETEARAEYGSISEWNVSAVTSLSESKCGGLCTAMDVRSNLDSLLPQRLLMPQTSTAT